MEVLKLGNLGALTDLDCSENVLHGTIDMNRFTQMYNFNCESNYLTRILVSELLVLENLSCESNNLQNELVIKSPVLKYLNCSYNLLTSLQIDHIDQLEIDDDFTVMGNKLRVIPQNLVTKCGTNWAAEEILLQKPDLDPSGLTDEDNDRRELKEYVFGLRTEAQLSERIKQVANRNELFLSVILNKIYVEELNESEDQSNENENENQSDEQPSEDVDSTHVEELRNIPNPGL